MSLFGDVSDESGFDERVDIPDIDYPKKQRLAFEKEMLGLYVSDHPLMGVERHLEKRVDVGLADLEEIEDGAMRTVGGVISNLQKKWTRKGDLMAVFVLEDLQSSVEAMVFPRTMTEVGHLLEDDAVVLVDVRVDKREDTPKLIVRSVELFEPHIGGSPPLRIAVSPNQLNDQSIGDMKQILAEFPGESDVFLHVGDRHVIALPEEFAVNVDSGVVGELRVLLGEGAIVL
jgi:DNA polymerase-3 subunit alpha